MLLLLAVELWRWYEESVAVWCLHEISRGCLCRVRTSAATSAQVDILAEVLVSDAGRIGLVLLVVVLLL